MSWCSQCKKCWAHRRGLCRACTRELAARVEYKEVIDRLAEQTQQRRAREEQQPREPLRAIEVDGEVFDVMWDGSL